MGGFCRQFYYAFDGCPSQQGKQVDAVDFKMITFLLGLKGSFATFKCFCSLWDYRATFYYCRESTGSSNQNS